MKLMFRAASKVTQWKERTNPFEIEVISLCFHAMIAMVLVLSQCAFRVQLRRLLM